jgi:hypothetical protein
MLDSTAWEAIRIVAAIVGAKDSRQNPQQCRAN